MGEYGDDDGAFVDEDDVEAVYDLVDEVRSEGIVSLPDMYAHIKTMHGLDGVSLFLDYYDAFAGLCG